MQRTIGSRLRGMLRRSQVGTRAFAAIALAGAFTAACDVHGISDPGSLASIVVTPNTTLAVGATQQMTAVGYDAEGRVVGISPAWSVAASGGSVGSSGMFTAGAITGVFANTVVASVGGISGRASITVTVGPLATITLTPNPVTLAVTATQQFVAVGKDVGGNVVPITPGWSVVAGGGSIDQTGIFTAGATAGTYTNTVQVSSSGIKAFATVIVAVGPLATITVTPNPATLFVGATQQFVATGRDASGNVVAMAPTWSIAAGGGTIDASGMFTAGGTPGTYAGTVKATSGSISGTATVIVTSGALATITVTPNPATVPTGGTQQFTAVGRDAAGNAVAITPTWAVVAGGGSIDIMTGLFTAGNAAGTYANSVRASVGGLAGFATVVVTSGALASITVLPNPATLVAGGTQQFVATGRDAGGNIIPITPVWTVAAGGGTINATGLFTAGAVAGTFTNTVTATASGMAGTATVIVTAAGPTILVNLGAAAPNGIMAGTAVTCVSLGTIFADVSVSPGTTTTGFPPCVITGTRHLNDGPAIQAQIDLTTAYNTLAGMPCPPANAIVANLGGTTKAPGVYCTASGIGVTGTLTLDGGGNSNAFFVFQAGSSLTTAGNIVLINGANAKNVYWQVGSSATIGTSSQWQGNILALTSITLVDNANLTGRALARNGAVSLGTGNTIILP